MASFEQLKLAVGDFPPFVESFPTNYLQYCCDTFVAGCIAHSLLAWRKTTLDNEIVSTMMGMKMDFDTTPRQKFFPNCTRSATEMIIIRAEIKKLHPKRVIESTARSCNEITSDVFVREKKYGTHRMILNLKNLNQHGNKIHFQMDTLNIIIKLADNDCFTATIDLKDAYHFTPITTPYRKYLKLSWRGSLYQFTCLPNGLSRGPRKFIRLLKPALSDLHLRGHISRGYINNLYLQETTYNDCVQNVIDTLLQIDSLGLIAHPEESAFNPSQP